MARAAAGKGGSRPRSTAATRNRVEKGVPVSDTSLSGDVTVASVISGSGGKQLPEMEVYWMLAIKHPYINACITLIADAIAGDGYSIVPTNGEDAKPLDNDTDPRVADIHEFFAVAFPGTTFRAVRFSIAQDVSAFGVAYLRKKRAVKMLVGLERLDPRSVTATLDTDQKTIVSFQVRRRNSNGIFDSTSAETIAAKDVILFTKSGGDPITGSPSPLEALDLTAAVDEAARRYRMAFFNSGGKVGTILNNEKATKEQFQAAERKMRAKHTGPDNAFGTMLLSGDWKLVGKLESGATDADFVKLSGLNREDVASVYHVPVGMITFAGNALGSAGKGDDRDFFEEFAVLPLEEIIYERLTLSLLRDEFEMTDIELAPKRRDRVRTSMFDAAMKIVKFGGTGNEARALVRLPAIVDPKFEMDTPLFIGSPTTGLAEAEPLDAPPAPVTTGSEQVEGDASASADGAVDEHTKREVAKRRRPGFAGLAKATDKKVVAVADPLAKKLAKIRDAIGTSVFGEVAKADGDVQSLTTAQYAKYKAAIDAIEAKLYADAIYDEATLLAETSYEGVRDLLELQTGFDAVPTWAIDALQSYANDIAGLAAERDRKTLLDVLDRALATGMSGPDTATALRDAFNAGVTTYDEDGTAIRTTRAPSWFKTVARTELQRASNLGQFSLYKAAGIAKVRWQAAEPCDLCADADDKVLPLGDVFPGVDVDMPPAHPNCRCVLIPDDDDLGDFGGDDDDKARARRGNQD